MLEYKMKEGRRKKGSGRLGNEGRIDRRKKVKKERRKKGREGRRKENF